MRPAAILVHRWVGLLIAVFLTMAGLTGSILAFYVDLDTALNPEVFVVKPPTPGAALLDPVTLFERLQAQLPAGKELQGVALALEPERTVNFWIDERETFVDPYTGNIVATRKFGDIREGKQSFLTFLYEFHFSLALGEVGVWLFGIVALLWTIDSFVGAYLTFPPYRERAAAKGGKGWVARWLPAWALKTNTLFSGVFTWHRASGLWVWGFLLVFAWSGVALNMREVYAPLMDAALGAHPEHEEEEEEPIGPGIAPRLDMRAALARGRELMAREVQARHFEIYSERSLYYDKRRGRYVYTVDSSLDVDERLAETHVELDGGDGRQLEFSAAGLSKRGTIDQWLIGLHFGAIRSGGLAYRSFVCVFGLLVALLSVTGVWIWLRKRTKRPRADR